MQVFVKRSVYNSIMKSLQDSKLEKLKAEVISILKRKEKENGGDAELKKAIAYFSKDEAHYSYLEKSASGEWIEKAGYGVGTVRIWKGKKYKKVSSSPVRWVRVFDKHDRGAATSMGKYIAQVKKCNSVEELYQFCMKQRSLFQDENGVDLPIMDKLKAAIDEQSGKLEGGKAEKNTAEENYIKNSGNKKLKDKVKAAIKKYGVTGQNLMNVLYSKDKELYNELDKMGADNAKQFIMQTNADNRDSKADDSKVLSNGKTVKEVRDQYGIKTDKKEAEKFWDGKVESDDGEGEFVAEMKGIGGGLYRNRFKTRAAAEKSVKNHQALGFESHVVEDKKETEKETEQEKHQNRSDAMKGNKNAYKGKDEMEKCL